MASAPNLPPSASDTPQPEPLLLRLEEVIRARQSLLTAFSGGIDSTLVAAVARRTLGRNLAPAAIGDSASLPRHELDMAHQVARELDFDLICVEPGEQKDLRYQANDGRRCYFCKTHLYAVLRELASKRGIAWIANGSNLDDLGDYRPGLAAAAEANVISPLVEAKLTKAEVRIVARHLNLPNWDKPAAACIASRIAFGTPVTLERLSRVEQAETILRKLGFSGFRVRHHEQVARIELPLDQITRLMDVSLRELVTQHFKELGYLYVTLDLEGFRSGSGNVMLDANARP